MCLGICRETSSGVIPSGPLQAQLNVGMCEGFNETFNAFTGFQSVSTINIEEMPTRKLLEITRHFVANLKLIKPCTVYKNKYICCK